MARPVPPNPSELIASDKTGELFSRLKEEYDYIILDTPPVGLVTDAFLLMQHSDANLFVVRQNYTLKKVFSAIRACCQPLKMLNSESFPMSISLSMM